MRNATLVWKENTENGPFECDNYLIRNYSILYDNKNCPSYYCGRFERAAVQNFWSYNKIIVSNVFKNGVYKAYGKAFRSMFVFNKMLYNKHLPPIDIAFHVRHHKFDGHEEHLDAMLKHSSQHMKRPCNAFVASDRISTLLYAKRQNYICNIHTLDRTTAEQDKLFYKQMNVNHGEYRELFMKELTVFENAKIVYGTYDSSSSELALSIAVSRKEADIYMCTGNSCTEQK